GSRVPLIGNRGLSYHHHESATIATPIAIAGAYANLLSASGDSIVATAADVFETRPAVAVSVRCKRRRRTATTSASTPPAIAASRNASTVRGGPSSAPAAANSFTSPAPVAPNM